MVDSTQRARWDTWMVQAQNFAKREIYMEAMARAQLVIDEVHAAIESASDDEKARLMRYRHRAERRQAKFREQFEVWNAAIAARRALATKNAATEMAEPLPIGSDQPIG